MVYTATPCRWIPGARWILRRDGKPVGRIDAAEAHEILERLNAPRWQARHPATRRQLKTR